MKKIIGLIMITLAIGCTPEADGAQVTNRLTIHTPDGPMTEIRYTCGHDQHYRTLAPLGTKPLLLCN